MEQNRVEGNAASLLGEIFLPGASQYMAGNVGSGIVHSLLAMSASALLIGSGAAPVIGALAVLGVKLNSYSFATTGRNLWDLGTEGPQDDREAARLYKLAADQGNADAQNNLGNFYRDGRGGLPQDDREAARLYRLAADQGNADAQANLANLVPPPSPDADAARVQAVGGQSGRLQIILAWDDRNDLDLHVVCPNGEEISYNNKRAGGGELDVDAAGVDSPAENIRFEAPEPGRYQIFVVFYNASAVSQSPFRVTIRRQGQPDQVIPGIARQQGERQLVQTVEFGN
jgi:TPR repeat protein